MEQFNIKCKLKNLTTSDGNNVILEFDNDIGIINFNSDETECLKKLFDNILKYVITSNVVIELEESDEDIKPSYIKDISEEYVNQLNNEISAIKTHINERLKDNKRI